MPSVHDTPESRARNCLDGRGTLHFYLNERQELSTLAPTGGGGPNKYEPIGGDEQRLGLGGCFSRLPADLLREKPLDFSLRHSFEHQPDIGGRGWAAVLAAATGPTVRAPIGDL
jgi:hypothetical protein